METIDVIILTYNQQEFIARAIQSVLNQIVDCKVKILVGDDASTDDTPKILEQYMDKIEVIRHSNNFGASKNLATLMTLCEGKYIAILEGDDYWTNQTKLQQQVNFLRQNKSFWSCGCDVQGIDNPTNPSWIRHSRVLKMKDYDGLDMCYQTSSIMFKNPHITNYWFLSKIHRDISDRILQGFLLTLGKAYRLKFPGVAYCSTNKKGLTYSVYQKKPGCYLLDLKMLKELKLLLSNVFNVPVLKKFKTTELMLFGKAYLYLAFCRDRKTTRDIIRKMMSITYKSHMYWFLLSPICIMIALLRKISRTWR